MAQELIDITGNTYNYLTVLGFDHMGKRRRSYWKCKCELCGKEVVIRKDSFAYEYSKVKSCGCWHRTESSMRERDKETGKYI